MKKLIVVFTALALLLCSMAVLAETDPVPAGTKITCHIVDSSYVIRINDPEGDLGWIADDMAQDDSVVKLGDAGLIEDAFVVRYDPAGDGDVTVGVRHYTGIACDEAHTFDLHVENGAVTDCTGGSYTASPDEAAQDPYLSGEWLESETQFTQMAIAKNAERGWDVEIASPLTHGAYVFKTTIYYDCSKDCFVYDKGKFWDVPITDEPNPELGEAKITGTMGTFSFAGDEQSLTLIWTDIDERHGEIAVVFERVAASDEAKENGIDYLALVNKLHPLPEGWEDALQTVTITNSVGDEVEVETKAYSAYELLRADLEQNDGIFLELDSARRSVAAQQDIMDRFIEKYGADYAAKTVATPGYSEHHTGLALDLYFKIKNDDGTFTDVYYNEDMTKPEYEGLWATIHAKLADYGFILRYLEGKEYITGYGYEPWHIRYVDSVETAREIMAQSGMTLEVWLGAATDANVIVDYGTSELYTPEELQEAAVQVKCRFASFAGCVLHSIRYAGDECNTEENLAWMKELDEGQGYVQVAEFISDFHSPIYPGEDTAWQPDKEYTSWEWWLARTADGGWQLLTWGYR